MDDGATPHDAMPAVLSLLEGRWLTPLVLGRQLTLNPLVIYVVVFWSRMWGAPGALTTVARLTGMRAVCAHALPEGACGVLVRSLNAQ